MTSLFTKIERMPLDKRKRIAEYLASLEGAWNEQHEQTYP